MIRRTAFPLAALATSTLLIAAFFLFQFFSKREVTTDKGQTYRIAILCAKDEGGVHDIIQGVIDTLESDANFTAQTRVFDGNGNRITMQANTEAAFDDGYDLLVTMTTQSTQLAKEVAARRKETTPIVFAGTGDPVMTGIVESLENPGSNITGCSVVGYEWMPYMLGLIKLFAPNTKRILLPYNPTALGGTLEEVKTNIVAYLVSLGYEVTEVQVFETNEVSTKVAPFVKGHDMMLILPDITMLEAMDVAAKLCERHGLFSYVTQNLPHIYKGAALAFGYHVRDMGIEAARLVIKILETGCKASDLPSMPLPLYRYRIAINREAAKRQGLLDQMDERFVYLMEHGMVV